MAPVQVDKTIGELYKQYCDCDVALLYYPPGLARVLAPLHLPNERYMVDSPVSNFGRSLEERQREMKILLLGHQKLAFIGGKADAFAIHDCFPDGLERVLGQLSQEQRPTVRLIDGHDEASIVQRMKQYLDSKSNINLLSTAPLQWCDDLQSVVPPGVVYRLYSKILLQRSRLNTPPAREMTIEIPRILEPPNSSWNDALDVFMRTELPFVVKLDFAENGNGTYLVNEEKKRTNLLKDFSARLRAYQQAEYHQFRPKLNLLLQDFIAASGIFCVHFLVPHDSERGIFLGAKSQLFDENERWKGATVDYGRQSELSLVFQQSIQDACQWLQGEGFMGVAGMDVVIDREGVQWIVDVNPRINGGLFLCLLQSHFMTRGRKHAMLASISYKGSMAQMEQSLANLNSTSELVWLGLCGPIFGMEESFATVVLGAPTADSLDDLHKGMVQSLKS